MDKNKDHHHPDKGAEARWEQKDRELEGKRPKKGEARWESNQEENNSENLPESTGAESRWEREQNQN